MVERWRMDYNDCRPHSSLDDATSVGFAGLCQQAGYIRSHQPVLMGERNGVSHILGVSGGDSPASGSRGRRAAGDWRVTI